MCSDNTVCLNHLRRAERFVVETPQGLVIVQANGSVILAMNDEKAVSPPGVAINMDNLLVEVDPIGVSDQTSERSEPAHVSVDLLTGKTRTSTDTIADRDAAYLDWAWAHENRANATSLNSTEAPTKHGDAK